MCSSRRGRIIEKHAEAFLRDLQASKSGKTVSTYKDGMSRFLRFLHDRRVTMPTQIGQAHIDGFVTWCHHDLKLKPASIRTYVASVMSFCRWLVRSGYLSRSAVFAKPEMPTVRRGVKFVMDEQGISDFARSCRSLDEPYRTILVLMAASGLRVHEALHLRHDHIEIDHVRGAVYLRVESEKSKGDNARRVPVLSFAYPYLRNYLRAHYYPLIGDPAKARGRPFFIYAERGQKTPSYRAVWGVLDGLVQDLGLKGHFSSHTLRRSYATFLYSRGVGPKEIQAILGHENFATTALYLKLTNADLAKVLTQAAWTKGIA